MVRHSCKVCNFHLCEKCWRKWPPQPPMTPCPPSAPHGSERRSRFWLVKRCACRLGRACGDRTPEHRNALVHPGDADYKFGRVAFDEDRGPEFGSLWQVFCYFDKGGTGYLDSEAFSEVVSLCQRMLPANCEAIAAGDAWSFCNGPRTGFANFLQFVSWAEMLGLGLPIGFEASTGEAKAYSVLDFMRPPLRDGLPLWTSGQGGLVPVTDQDMLSTLQGMLDSSHKETDNWTRDRGCSLHGVNCCAESCASRNRVKVPNGYVIVSAFRNQNEKLWERYCMQRRAVAETCADFESGSDGSSSGSAEAGIQTAMAGVGDLGGATEPLDTACHEWRLLHGTSSAGCRSICTSNFALDRAGTGSTWKDPGQQKGTPPYGFGIYFAERITKADEYAAPSPSGDDTGLHSVLVCRVAAGRTLRITTNDIDAQCLRHEVFATPFHSVLGDRVSSLGKPYREVVVYDPDLVYPEFLLVYARAYR